ncbi:hypothetical protein [Microbacterium sp. NIBRBAC000506063]|uniref:hypothetical protein n=1 Tax=Microbacterium sp. NIBRBAC000506063 TaxID=2734618 RepID=UPI001BB5696E|nr:hypothetical protein [Microbacterium sp. NIBRBAC000506063]QTV80216.1 hypothetical protein KAE78_04055 [Microbacterium sp. NIBRBAC000506063]
MAYDDIDIPMATMADLEKAITDAIGEFESATGNSEALEAAIGSPLGRSELRSEAQRFEEAWDDKRETLRRNLEDLLERVSGTRQSWQDLDSELATAMEAEDGNDG